MNEILELDEFSWARVRSYVESLEPGAARHKAETFPTVFANELAVAAAGRRTRKKLAPGLVREALKWAAEVIGT